MSQSVKIYSQCTEDKTYLIERWNPDSCTAEFQISEKIQKLFWIKKKVFVVSSKLNSNWLIAFC